MRARPYSAATAADAERLGDSQGPIVKGQGGRSDGYDGQPVPHGARVEHSCGTTPVPYPSAT